MAEDWWHWVPRLDTQVLDLSQSPFHASQPHLRHPHPSAQDSMGRAETVAEQEVNTGKEEKVEEARNARGAENKVEGGAP